jgi:hypothetical protein
VIFWLLSFVLAVAGPVEEGAAAWEAGDAATAISTWTQAAEHGTASGTLLFDLGVAHYRMGDPARSVAYFRAARRLRPRDAELVHNLARARNKIEGAPDPAPMPVGWMEFLTVGEVGVLGLLVLAAGLGGLAVRRRRRELSPWPWLSVAAVGLVLSLAALEGARHVAAHPALVVLDGTAVARDAAQADARERFELPPGSEVRVERARGAWVLVSRSDGERGWIPRVGTLMLTPRIRG